MGKGQISCMMSAKTIGSRGTSCFRTEWRQHGETVLWGSNELLIVLMIYNCLTKMVNAQWLHIRTTQVILECHIFLFFCHFVDQYLIKEKVEE